MFNCFLCFIVIHHIHKTKSAAFSRFFIHGNFGRLDGTEFFKDFFQFCVIQIVWKAGNKEIRAVIRADKKVEHGRVIHVLDLLRQGGIAKIAFAVSPVAPKGAAEQPAPK